MRFLANAIRVAGNPSMLVRYCEWMASRQPAIAVEGQLFSGFATFSDYWSFYKDRPTAGEIALIRRELSGGGVAIDVGANIGLYAFLMARASSAVEVHAFEPVGRTFGLLRRNLRQIPNVRCHRLAVSDYVGTAHMTCFEAGFTMNRITEPDSCNKVEVVVIITIENFCQNNNIDAIQLIKIDVEGKEPEVLHGLGTLRPSTIIIEICPSNLERSGSSIIDLYECIDSLGYKVYDLSDDGFPHDELSLKDLAAIKLANVVLKPAQTV